jgi:hypothetical protein
MFDSLAPLAWIVTAVIIVCFIFNLFSSASKFNWVLGLAVLLWVFV